MERFNFQKPEEPPYEEPYTVDPGVDLEETRRTFKKPDNPEGNKRAKEIVFFDVIESKTDDFNFVMDQKLEEYRQRMERYAESDDPRSQLKYLDAKYKLHIGNAVRFKGGANYGMIFDSLVKQDGGVNEEIFDTAWRVIKAYVSGEEEKISGGTGFGLKRLESDTEGLAPDFLEIAPMEHEGDKEWAWRPVFKNSSQKETWNYTGIYVLDKYGNENYNGKDKLLAFLQSKFGKHKNIVIPDAYKPE